MNNVKIIGLLEKNPEVIFNNEDGSKKLYKFTVKVDRPYKNKDGRTLSDYINVKAWSNVLQNAYDLYEDTIVAIEGRISSFGKNDEESSFANELIANKVIPLN